MKEKLQAFDKLAEAYGYTSDGYDGDPELYNELHRTEPTIRKILQALDPALADGVNVSAFAGEALARRQVQRGLGILNDMDDWDVRLVPDAPALLADRLHPWVWESAVQLWAADARQDAVLAASRTVNRRMQQKLGRHDVSDTDLCMQSFDLKDPTEGKPRLRIPGDRTTPTWRARQEGAKYFGAGVFQAIRNVAAHEDTVTWSEQEALEFLASLSVFARWVDECVVEAAQPTT